MRRIFLFVVTNIAVMVVIGVMASVLGVDRWMAQNGLDYWMLFAFSALWGFSGSLISLLMSKFMAKMAYGIRIVEDGGSTPEERWLAATVERLAHDVGLPMPEVGIYDSPEVNAFATGPSRGNALVAVSAGLLQCMDRRQAEAVLAHEISHVSNGDMVTMTLLQGVLNTFVIFLSRVIAFAIDNALRKDDREGPGLGFSVASLFCQIALSFLASLVVMAYSRHREYRADAGAAELRGKESMISALEALKRQIEGGIGVDTSAKSLATFKINGIPGHLFATHPPLEARIEALRAMR